MISANDLRRGSTFEMDGELYKVVEYQHSFIGRGSANVRVKMRNLRTGAMTDRTFSPDDRISDVRLELRGVQYLYNDGTFYYFMDTETYEQPTLSAEILGDTVDYLTENMNLQISTYDGEPIDIVGRDLQGHVLGQVVYGITQELGREGRLFVVLGVHEVVKGSVVVEVLHSSQFQADVIDAVIRREGVVGYRSRAQVAHLDSHVGAAPSDERVLILHHFVEFPVHFERRSSA